MTASPYQFMPDLSDEQYAALKDDIGANGVQVPVVKDEFGNVIDGHQRASIAEHLGIDYPVDVRKGLTEDAKKRLALTLNANRRHLDRAEKRALIAESLRLDPQLSDRHHGRRCGASPHTVATVRRDLQRAGDVCKTHTRTDSAGRQQPAFKPIAETVKKIGGGSLQLNVTEKKIGGGSITVNTTTRNVGGGSLIVDPVSVLVPEVDPYVAVVNIYAETPAVGAIPGSQKPAESTKKPTGRDRLSPTDLQYENEDLREQIRQLKTQLSERDQTIAELREELRLVKAKAPSAKPKEPQHDRLLRLAVAKLSENGPMSHGELSSKFESKDRPALREVLDKARTDGLVTGTPTKRGSTVWALAEQIEISVAS